MWPLITRSILIQSASFSHDCHTLAAAMVTCRGRREGVREVRCLCFNRCDIYTQSHLHRYFSASVSLPRSHLKMCICKKKHTTVIFSSTWAFIKEILFFFCANQQMDMSSSTQELHNLGSLKRRWSPRQQRSRLHAAKVAILFQKNLKWGQEHHSPTSLKRWKS